MDPRDAERLTALFNGRAINQAARLHEVRLSYHTDMNCGVNLELEMPRVIAAYMRHALQSANPLFRRFDQAHYQSPLILSFPGDIFNPADRRLTQAHLARLRFFDTKGPSELCFAEDFIRPFDEVAKKTRIGPALPEFLAALDKANEDWRAMSLSRRRPGHHMRIVPRPPV